MDNPEEEAYFSKKATLLTVSPQATRVSLISTAPSLQSFIASRSNSKTWYEHLRFVITQNLHNVRKEGQTEGLTAKVILTSLLKISVFTRKKKSIRNIAKLTQNVWEKWKISKRTAIFMYRVAFNPRNTDIIITILWQGRTGPFGPAGAKMPASVMISSSSTLQDPPCESARTLETVWCYSNINLVLALCTNG